MTRTARQPRRHGRQHDTRARSDDRLVGYVSGTLTTRDTREGPHDKNVISSVRRPSSPPRGFSVLDLFYFIFSSLCTFFLSSSRQFLARRLKIPSDVRCDYYKFDKSSGRVSENPFLKPYQNPAICVRWLYHHALSHTMRTGRTHRVSSVQLFFIIFIIFFFLSRLTYLRSINRPRTI